MHATADDKAETEWSADLLNQILKTETPKVEPTATTVGGSVMELHTYQLAHLRISETRARNLISILTNLLPPGSTLKEEVPANSLHILTTPAAHKAAWEYLSAVDIGDSPAPTSTGIPEDVKAALGRLAAAGDQSDKLVTAVGSLRTEVSAHLAEIETRQRKSTLKLVGTSIAFGAILLVTIGWMMRRRAASVPPTPEPSTALAVSSENLATALLPVQEKMRGDMLGMLNEVAIKLQAQHNEQQKLVREQQQQIDDARQALADERRQFITEAGTMVVQAVERVDATTAKLARQQDKVAELVEELQNTVRELDDTKDSLRDREIELEQERSKIAALSLLLEEGSPLPTNGHGTGNLGFSENNHVNEATIISTRVATTMPCTTSDPAQTEDPRKVLPPSHNRAVVIPLPRFTFLPPDHPET